MKKQTTAAAAAGLALIFCAGAAMAQDVSFARQIAEVEAAAKAPAYPYQPQPPMPPHPGPWYPGPVPGYEQIVSVVCQSFDGDSVTCPVNGLVRDLWLKHQYSNTPCKENVNFGRGDTYVWVNKGCRAEFNVRVFTTQPPPQPNPAPQPPQPGPYPPYPPYPPQPNPWQPQPPMPPQPAPWNPGYDQVVPVTCQCFDGQYTTCPVSGRVREVWVKRQFSNTPCREGLNFGKGETYIWVDKGCRAEFNVRI